MNSFSSHSFSRSMKGKVIIAFIAGCIAFILAWKVSRVAFQEMLHTVEQITAPNQKLRIVNDLYRDITSLDQLQRAQALEGDTAEAFLNESKKLRTAMNSLAGLYQNEPAQLRRIDSMKSILLQRDSLFLLYLNVREGLVKGKAFADQLDALSGLISKSSAGVDSTVITTEHKRSTTTIVPPENNDKKHERGFFGRLFGKKKEEKKEDEVTEDPTKVVQEEVNIKIDTLALANQEKVIRKMEKAVKTLEKRREQQSLNFVSREADLANAGNNLITQMLAILQQVEKEVIRQADNNNRQAAIVVNTSIKRISLIMLAFLLLTAILVYLILMDIGRSNRHRMELEAARDEAEYHSQAKQRFLSNMSHEIRTPLQSIIGYAELILRRENPSKKDVETIYQSSRHLLHIVNEVLDYSRIISGKFKFERSVFNISGLLEEVISIMHPQAAAKNLELQLCSDIGQNEYVDADPFRLKQILLNLLGNAVKFTEKGRVSLTASNEIRGNCSYCRFIIEDTGPGISEENIRHIFNEFERADNAAAAGTGLGLSIVKALTEGQNGSVEIESGSGKGTRFTVNLKLRTAAAPEISEENPAEAAAFTDKVWIVDDDLFILQYCSSVFEKNTIDYDAFQLPSQVLQAPVNENLGVVFMDMRMPQMNGTELYKRMREKLPDKVKIIALTAQALPEERKQILQHGFDGLLMKPFTETDLLNTLHQYACTLKPAVEMNGKETLVKQTAIKNGSLDLSALHKMTFGDPQLMQKIMKRFVEDSTNDIQQLLRCLPASDAEETALLLHRIAGRTSQLGANELGARFRKEENMVRQNGLPEKEQQQRITAYARELYSLISRVQKELRNEAVNSK